MVNYTLCRRLFQLTYLFLGIFGCLQLLKGFLSFEQHAGSFIINIKTNTYLPTASTTPNNTNTNTNTNATNHHHQRQRQRQQQQRAEQKPFTEIEKSAIEFIDSLEIGWSRPAAKWLKDLCPEVVDHFSRFPSFKHVPPPNKNRTLFKLDRETLNQIPLSSSEYLAHAVCTLKATKALTSSINAHLYLYAGSQLGAILHGQPIPWDDDIDAIMSAAKANTFLSKCKNGAQVYPTVRLFCIAQRNAIKVWLQPDDMVKQTVWPIPHYSPFVDLFLFKVNSKGYHVEVSPTGEVNDQVAIQKHSTETFFPTRPYYFGGIYILGPAGQIAQERYKLNICKIPSWNHRLKQDFPRTAFRGARLDCHKLAQKFPFRREQDLDSVTNGKHTQALYPATRAAIVNPTLETTQEQRYEWKRQDASLGQNLTDHLIGLNEVEIDNSIASNRECQSDSTRLKVVEFNAERGRWWLEAADQLDVLKDADIIILNEMDIGMARTDQQHTARQMAYFLGMNYAFGVEFVELTLGDKGDLDFLPSDRASKRLNNFHGLHGNAFLTKCEISDPILFRNKVGPYFSDKSEWVNAGGLEKRLGGRMGMFGRIIVNGIPVVVGSIHKLDGFRQEMRDYMGSSKVVVAGDQGGTYCKEVGLKLVIPKDHNGYTWPASCSSFGRGRGDNICTNMEEQEPEVTTKPCVTSFGFPIFLSDHALTSVVLNTS